MNKLFLILCFLLTVIFSYGQRPLDVLHYKYEIELSDKSDTIRGKAMIRVRFLKAVDAFSFDVKSVDEKGKGLTASLLTEEGASPATAIHKDDKLTVTPSQTIKAGDERTYVISYEGVPADGLIISKNRFGQRTFFSDNWPDRAKNWIPCIDDPADKASVEFIVTAPAHYKIVSNGVLVEETSLGGDKQLSHWKEEVPLPTKVIAIAAADFAVQYADTVKNIPVSIWAFTPNKKDGFRDYAPAAEILYFFIDYIGPFPYKKLANVQSKTIFGGMENAGAIFYAENTVNGKQNQHTLIAHEISHQWFGDMVTEKSFAHLWLSEGFATYMAILFMEKKFGIQKAKELLEEDRQQAIAFSRISRNPVVDTASSLMELLNANSYQKGGWVLHMLRHELGDSVFRKAVQTFYSTYAGKNADTRDLQQVVEKVAKKDMSVFFQQWLYTPGIPKLDVKCEYDAVNKKVNITVRQSQKNVFQFPLEILIQTSSKSIEKLNVTQPMQTFFIPVKDKPSSVKLDPNTNLLFDGRLL